MLRKPITKTEYVSYRDLFDSVSYPILRAITQGTAISGNKSVSSSLSLGWLVRDGITRTVEEKQSKPWSSCLFSPKRASGFSLPPIYRQQSPATNDFWQ